MKIQAGAILTGYRRLSDRSVNLTFNTAEQSPQSIMEIDSLLQSHGVLYYRSVDRLTKSEIEELDKFDTDLYEQNKSQSQRLKNVLYRLFEQNNNGYADFKDFYKFETEKIINHYKNKLDQ